MRKKLKESEKKVRVIITLDPQLNNLLKLKSNKSKYIEELIRNDIKINQNEN